MGPKIQGHININIAIRIYLFYSFCIVHKENYFQHIYTCQKVIHNTLVVMHSYHYNLKSMLAIIVK